MKYDYLIVGAGLFGAVFAREAVRRGKKVLVLDRRDHIGGNIYTKETEGIDPGGRPAVPACQRSGRRGAGRNDRCQPDRSSPGWSLGSLV